jgi:hypothetical protein
MADEKKSLEARVAELEDKLSKIHVTEEEMKAYHKVSSLVGGASPAAGCVVDCSGGCINECAVRACTIVRQCTVIRSCIRQCTIIRQCTWECFECGGGCAPGGGAMGGGGFGSLGG